MDSNNTPYMIKKNVDLLCGPLPQKTFSYWGIIPSDSGGCILKNLIRAANGKKCLRLI